MRGDPGQAQRSCIATLSGSGPRDDATQQLQPGWHARPESSSPGPQAFDEADPTRRGWVWRLQYVFGLKASGHEILHAQIPLLGKWMRAQEFAIQRAEQVQKGGLELGPAAVDFSPDPETRGHRGYRAHPTVLEPHDLPLVLGLLP